MKEYYITTTDSTITVNSDEMNTTEGHTFAINEDVCEDDQLEWNTPDEMDVWPCMHDSCPECGGTGMRKCGGLCIHNLSCPCPRCSPRC